jgi:hypothetical protein
VIYLEFFLRRLLRFAGIGQAKLEPLSQGEALHKIAVEIRLLGFKLPEPYQPEQVVHAFRNMQQELIGRRELQSGRK